MNNKIFVIVTIVTMLIFVGGYMMMNGTIMSKANESNKKLNETLVVTDMELTNYDNTLVSGDTLVSAIKNGKALGGNIKLKFIVKTKASIAKNSFATYGYVDSETYENYNISDLKHDDYVNPTASFESIVEKNSNGVVTQIKFTQK